MVYIALKSVNKNTHASARTPRAAIYAVSLAALIFITMTNTFLVSVNTLFTSATTMMRTMTSMMIIMPIKGIR